MFDTIIPYHQDEILYSWLSRMKSCYGYSMTDVKKNFFVNHKIIPREIIKFDHELMKKFSVNSKASSEMFKEMSIDNFYYYIQDYLIQNPKVYLKDISRSKYFNKIGYFYFSEDNFMKFCPYCIENDKQRYGYTFIKKKHMVYGNSFCSIHNCNLKYIKYTRESLLKDIYDINTIDISNAKECLQYDDKYIYKIVKVRSQFIDYFYNSNIITLLESFRNKIYIKLVNENILQEDFTLELRRLKIYKYRGSFVSFSELRTNINYIIYEGNYKRLSILDIIDILCLLFESVDDFLNYPSITIPEFIINPLVKETYYIRDLKKDNVYHEVEYTSVKFYYDEKKLYYLCYFECKNYKFCQKFSTEINAPEINDGNKFKIFSERDLYNKYIDKDLYEVKFLKDKKNCLWKRLLDYHIDIQQQTKVYDNI